MNPRNIESLSNLLVDTFREVGDFQPGARDSVRSIFMRRNMLVSMDSDDLSVYRRVVDEIEKECRDKCSKGYIEDHIKDIIIDYINDGNADAVLPSLDKFISSCESYDVEHTVLMPVSGVQVAGDHIQLGRVKLKNKEQTLSDLKSIADGLEEGTNKEKILRQEIHAIENSYSASTYATVQLVAESNKAIERAAEECEFVLDGLVLASIGLANKGLRVAEGLALQAHETRQNFVAIVFGSEGGYYSTTRVVGQVGRLELNEESLKKMESWGITKALEFTLDTQDEIESQIIRALHWFAESLVQGDRGNKLLGLIIVLEMFFTPEGREPIAEVVSESTALLLSDNLEDRKEIKNFIKRMYRQRSALSHGRKVETTEWEIDELTNLVVAVILTVTENEQGWTSLDAIRSFFEDYRLRDEHPKG